MPANRTPGTIAREEALAHRIAIAKRFAALLDAGEAVFTDPRALASAEPPRLIVDGVARPLSGFNRWMLSQVQRDQGWHDGRFFTRPQAEQAYGPLPVEARPVLLQTVSVTDADGELLAQPDVRLVPVFNAVQLNVKPSEIVSHKVSPSSLAAELVAEGFEPGADVARGLADWVEATARDVAGAAAAPPALLRTMAIASVASEVGWDSSHLSSLAMALGSAHDWSATANWVRSDPVAFYEAIRAADEVAGVLVHRLRLLALQRGVAAALDFAGRPGAPESRAREEDTMAVGQTQLRSPRGGEGRSREAYEARLEAMFEEREAVLAVPFSQKDRAYELGAVWFGRRGVWFVPKGGDLRKFSEWNPQQPALSRTVSDREIVEQFRKAMDELGLDTSVEIKADGLWHNVRVVDNKGSNLSGAYLLSLNGGRDNGPVGHINNKYSGESRTWALEGAVLTPEQSAKLRAQVLQRAAEAHREMERSRATAAEHAKEILVRGADANGHPYAVRKGIPAEGLRQVRGAVLLEYQEFRGESGRSAIRPDGMYLVVPMCDSAGQVRAVQAISEDGRIKSFMRGAQKKGLMSVLGASSLEALFDQVGTSAGVA
jgi:hypothetical protein